MDRTAGQRRAADYLYPPIDPFDQRVIDMGDGHRIYVEQCGNPQGKPVIVVHGGPGGGCSPAMRRYFDPAVWRIILFDQRGCGRSRPLAAVEDNTTWHLVADMEKIRTTLGISSWTCFGGSWGATLSLVYAISHPTRVTELMLRGVFLMTNSELEWFYGGGAGAFFPELWSNFSTAIPASERGNLIDAYAKRLFSGDFSEETRFAKLWAGWENALASFGAETTVIDAPGDYARTFARLENHYFRNGGFLQTDNWILQNRSRIEHLPLHLVQGRHDVICPPKAAWTLANGWPNSKLEMIPRAGHALSEPGITAALVRATDALRPRQD